MEKISCGRNMSASLRATEPVRQKPPAPGQREAAGSFWCQLRQLGDVRRDAPRRVPGEQLRCRLAACLTFEIHVGERVPVSAADNEAPSIQLGIGLVDGPRRREAVLGLFYRQDKTGQARACSARANSVRIPRAFWMADFIGIDLLLGEGTMPAAYSADIRGRVIASVESGSSRREAAEEFDVSASSAIKWVAAYRTTGSCAAKPRGGSTSPLEKYTTFLLTLIEGQPDLTLDEVVCAMRKRKLPGSRTAVWRFFQRHKITFKKKPERGGAAARRRGAGAATLDARTGHV